MAVKITFEVTKSLGPFGKFEGTFDAHLRKGIKFNPCSVKMEFTDQSLAECLITLETKASRLLEYDDLSSTLPSIVTKGMGWLEPKLWKKILADLANPRGFQTDLPLELPLKNELVRTPTIHTVLLADQDHRRGSLKPRRTASDTDALQLHQCLAYIINGAVFEGSMREYWENKALKRLREIPAIKQKVSAIREFEIGGRRPFSGLGFTIRGFKLRYKLWLFILFCHKMM
eukprot:COSAG02_NODE_22499_length_750_cov_1.239631_1_plen_229_part_10